MDKEDHYVPMEMMRLKSKCLQPLFKDTRMKNLYKQYLWYLQEHLLDKLGLEDNGGLLEKMNRDNMLVEAVNHRLDIKKKFQKLFQELKESKSSPSISPNVRKLALTYGFNKNNPKDWEYLWRVYEESSSDADRRFLHKSLSSFDEPELFSRTLENTLDLTKVRSQDTLLWLREISNNSTNEKIWNFMTKNWNTFRERFGDGGCLADLVHHIATTFQTSEKLNEVKEFLNSSGKNLMSQKLKERTIEEIKNNLLRKRDRNTDHISITKAIKWLQKYMKKIAAKQNEGKKIINLSNELSKPVLSWYAKNYFHTIIYMEYENYLNLIIHLYDLD
ncbi:aminopeptidase Ey-like isoform X1 [Xenia sp. Carnegie-2017]|uniref:aminopeptidase Ey-like isoform X1 n=1 Tax=Xenia sp. Carnegie-2017 TaxID=2897299 RepID=UPI001F048274|nr:aminopeptidase Ey-like isoform X1 [Xenia sp. Carnegie-2017]